MREREEHIETIRNNIDACFDNTSFGYSEIKNMKANAVFMFEQIYDLNKTKYFLEEWNEEVTINIGGYKFGHNDMHVIFNDFATYKALRSIFIDLKEKGLIGAFGTNGWFTSFVLSYESIMQLKEKDFTTKIKFLE